jgi:hypothetical protein
MTIKAGIGSHYLIGEEMANMIARTGVGLRTCMVSYCDLKGVEHAV